MNSSKLILRALRVLTILLPMGILPVAWAGEDSTPLIDKVHNATAQYLDINVAFAQGFVTATPCVSGPDTGPDEAGSFDLRADGKRCHAPRRRRVHRARKCLGEQQSRWRGAGAGRESAELHRRPESLRPAGVLR